MPQVQFWIGFRAVISYLCSVHLPCALKAIIDQPLRMLSLLQRLYCILELVAHRFVKKVSAEPFVCSPLLVVVNSKGVVLNLRHLNQFLCKDKFKYKDLQVALLLFQKGDFLFKFDLKSDYHHVGTDI